jgi:hypothetical protein
MNLFHDFIGIGDIYSYIWAMWHAHNTILTLKFDQLFYTNKILYPEGASFVMNLPIFNSLITLGVYKCCGSIAAYNFLVIFTFIMTFLGMYLFLKLLVKTKTSAFLGALAFTFSFYRIVRLYKGQGDLLSTQWIGFYLYFFYQWFYLRKKIADIFFMSLFFGLQIYTDLRTLVVFFVLVVLTFITAGMNLLKNNQVKRFIQSIVLFTFINLAIITPFLLYSLQLADTTFLIGANELEMPRSNILGFFWSDLRHRGVYLGWFNLLFVAIYLFFLKKKKKEKQLVGDWLVISVVFLLLTLGATITIAGKTIYTGKLLPFYWILQQPLLRFFHVPARFVLGLYAGIAVFIALGVDWIVTKIRNRYRKAIFSIIILIFLILQNIHLYPDFFYNSNIYWQNDLIERLKNEPEGTVLAIPVGYFDSFHTTIKNVNEESMFDQIKHSKPLIGGVLSYIDSDKIRSFENKSVWQKIIKCQWYKKCVALNDEEEKLLQNYYNVKYILIYNSELFKHVGEYFRQMYPRAETIYKSTYSTYLYSATELIIL